MYFHSSPFNYREVLISMTSMKNYSLRPKCRVLSGEGGSWVLYITLEMNGFSSVQFLKAGYTIKRLVCRHKGNNLTGASRSVTLSAPFKNHTSSLAFILTPPSAEQITPLQFHNSGKLFTHFSYDAVSSFQENQVRHCGTEKKKKERKFFFPDFSFSFISSVPPCFSCFPFLAWQHVWMSLHGVYQEQHYDQHIFMGHRTTYINPAN